MDKFLLGLEIRCSQVLSRYRLTARSARHAPARLYTRLVTQATLRVDLTRARALRAPERADKRCSTTADWADPGARRKISASLATFRYSC